MVLVQHHRDLAIAFAQYHRDVPANYSPQPLFRIRSQLRGRDHAFFGDVHGMTHQVEKNFFLTLKVMIKSALAELECRSYAIHRGRVITLLLEEAGSGAQNSLTRPQRALAGDRSSYRTSHNSSH